MTVACTWATFDTKDDVELPKFAPGKAWYKIFVVFLAVILIVVK